MSFDSTTPTQSRRVRLLNLRLKLLKIAKDLQEQEADGRIEKADLVWLEQAASTMDEMVSWSLPSPTVVRKTKFLGMEISWWRKKAPKSPK